MHNFLLVIIITPRRSSEKEEIIQALRIFFLVCVVSPFIVAVDGTRSSQIEAAT
jgi:hypothetical protein